MKLNEQEYKEKIFELYGDEIIIMNYSGLSKPLYINDKYGKLKIPNAAYLLKYKPTIKLAINKTLYFLNVLKEKHYNTYKLIQPISDYKSAKTKMLFNTKYGIVAISPDSLLSGHIPNIRSAINKKEYMRNQLLDLYNYKYDFKIKNVKRKIGQIILICPIHGEVLVDND